MAIWQYKLDLFAKECVQKEYGRIPKHILHDVINVGKPPRFLDDQELGKIPNLWSGRDWNVLCAAAAKILPEVSSWSEEARMFGETDGNWIEVWADDINIKVDCRSLDRAFLASIVEMVTVLDAVLVDATTGTVLESRIDCLEQTIRNSTAQEFIEDPYGTMKKVGFRMAKPNS